MLTSAGGQITSSGSLDNLQGMEDNYKYKETFPHNIMEAYYTLPQLVGVLYMNYIIVDYCRINYC